MPKYLGLDFYQLLIIDKKGINFLKPLIISNNCQTFKTNLNNLTNFETQLTSDSQIELILSSSSGNGEKGTELKDKSSRKVRFDSSLVRFDPICRQNNWIKSSETSHKFQLKSILKSNESKTKTSANKWPTSGRPSTPLTPLRQSSTQRLTLRLTEPKNFSNDFEMDLHLLKNNLNFKRFKCIETNSKTTTETVPIRRAFGFTTLGSNCLPQKEANVSINSDSIQSNAANPQMSDNSNVFHMFRQNSVFIPKKSYQLKAFDSELKNRLNVCESDDNIENISQKGLKYCDSIVNELKSDTILPKVSAVQSVVPQSGANSKRRTDYSIGLNIDKPFNPKKFSFNWSKSPKFDSNNGSNIDKSIDNVFNKTIKTTESQIQNEISSKFTQKSNESMNCGFEVLNTKRLTTETESKLSENVVPTEGETQKDLNMNRFLINIPKNYNHLSANNRSKDFDSNSSNIRIGSKSENQFNSNNRKIGFSTEHQLNNFINLRKNKKSFSNYRFDPTKSPFNQIQTFAEQMEDLEDIRRQNLFRTKSTADIDQKNKHFAGIRANSPQKSTQSIPNVLRNRPKPLTPKVFNNFSKYFDLSQNEE